RKDCDIHWLQRSAARLVPLRGKAPVMSFWQRRCVDSHGPPTRLRQVTSGKWLELIKEIAPRVTRVAVLRDLTIGIAQLAAIQSVAPSLGIELRPVNVRDADEIERSMAAFAQGLNGALIVTASTSAIIHRELI